MFDDYIALKLERAIYNDKFRWACRDFCGQWNPKEQSWVFPIEYAEEVERLNRIYNSDFVEIELTFLADFHCFEHRFFLAGYPIACGAYTKAYFEKGVKQIKGDKPTPFSLDNYLIHKGTVITLTMTRFLLTEVAQKWKGTLSLRDTAQPNCVNDLEYGEWTSKQ